MVPSAPVISSVRRSMCRSSWLGVAPRPSQELAATVRAGLGHRRAAASAEGTLVAADESVRLKRQAGAALLAVISHLERHGILLRSRRRRPADNAPADERWLAGVRLRRTRILNRGRTAGNRHVGMRRQGNID